MANVQLAVAGDDTTQVILSVPGVQGPTGSSIPPSGTTNQVLYKQSNTDYDTGWSLVTSAMIASGTIVNEDVNASAAIAGTKISPNFGSQNVVTTGTSTAASFIPTSSGIPTNGMYLPSANNVAISTNGTGRLFITSAGLVGIGTSSPSRLLSVVGSSAGGMLLERTGSIANAHIEYKTISGSVFAGQGSGNEFTIGSALDLTSTSNTFASFSSGEIQLLTSGTPRLRINSSGNVGIGTTSPDEPLHISAGDPAIKLQDSDGTNQYSIIKNASGDSIYDAVNGTGTAGAHIFRSPEGSANEKMRIDSSGRLLVGTSTSAARYSVESQFQVSGASRAASSISLSQTETTGTEGGAIYFWHSDLDIDDSIGLIQFGGAVGGAGGQNNIGATIEAIVDGVTYSGGDQSDLPTRLVFSVTADGASSPTEALRISNNRAITVSDGGNIVLGTGTGTKIGTSTSQKIGFFNETPIVQPTTGIAEAAFVENSGGTAVNVDSTFGGYTIQQVVQALQNLGLLA